MLTNYFPVLEKKVKQVLTLGHWRQVSDMQKPTWWLAPFISGSSVPHPHPFHHFHNFHQFHFQSASITISWLFLFFLIPFIPSLFDVSFCRLHERLQIHIRVIHSDRRNVIDVVAVGAVLFASGGTKKPPPPPRGRDNNRLRENKEHNVKKRKNKDSRKFRKSVERARRMQAGKEKGEGGVKGPEEISTELVTPLHIWIFPLQVSFSMTLGITMFLIPYDVCFSCLPFIKHRTWPLPKEKWKRASSRSAIKVISVKFTIFDYDPWSKSEENPRAATILIFVFSRRNLKRFYIFFVYFEFGIFLSLFKNLFVNFLIEESCNTCC